MLLSDWSNQMGPYSNHVEIQTSKHVHGEIQKNLIGQLDHGEIQTKF